MNRRGFIAAAGASAGVAAIAANEGLSQVGDRECYELREYVVADDAQKGALLAFLDGAMIPAVRRAGLPPVGVFESEEQTDRVWVLLAHPSASSSVSLTQTLLEDEAFLADGDDVISAITGEAAYTRVSSSLLLAFEGMPNLERPVENPERVFQLRIYESPSVLTGQRKIEMFNSAEIDIFRKTGLNPVFFGEAVVGASMPNLTYMLGFENGAEQGAAWQRFIADPEWLELRARPEYADDEMLCGITNIPLRPAACSEI